MNEEMPKRRLYKQFRTGRGLDLSPRLWCGKVQGLCDGSVCSTCHLFPHRDSSSLSIERGSLLSSATMTDHEQVGLTSKDDEE